MRSRRVLLVPVLLVALLTVRAGAQPMGLDAVGGALGETLTLTVSGPPGADYLLLMSLATGPTPLPPPHVSPIDVGLELVTISISIPGFLATLPGGGSVALPLPVPVLPALDGLNLNFQALRIQGPKFAEKSNLYRITFDTKGGFAPTLHPLAQARAFCTANLLPDGTVLVAGGGVGTITSASGLATAELYRPNLESFELLPPMNSARALHRSTMLADGRVLLSGGVDSIGTPLQTAEIFDPGAGTFTLVGAMTAARVGHTATRLPDGRVLIVGGASDLSTADAFVASATQSSEIFDPATNAFSPGPNVSEPKTLHDAVLLADGRVLVSGGLTYFTLFGQPIPDPSNRAQLYTASAGAGSFGGVLTMGAKRVLHSSLRLDDGRVLLAGGGSGNLLAPSILGTCELFDPASSSFAPTGAMATPRALGGLVRLPSGEILVAGGAQGDILNPTAVAGCERYAQTSGTWTSAGSMLTSRSGHGVVLLEDQTVLLVAGGGGPANGALSSAEILQP